MHNLKRWLWAFILYGLIITPLAAALNVPPLGGRVNDLADMIHPSTEQQLEAALAQLEKSDSTQVVILTIPSLGGEALEEYSMRVAEQWQIGQKEVDNGVLLLVSKNDRKIRIEAGYGLEGKLTDLTAGRQTPLVKRWRWSAASSKRTFPYGPMTKTNCAISLWPMTIKIQPCRPSWHAKVLFRWVQAGGFRRTAFFIFAFLRVTTL